MRRWIRPLALPVVLATIAFFGCTDQDPTEPAGHGVDLEMQAAKGGGGKPNPELAGNNLSFPVIWAEGVGKTLPGVPGMEPLIDGAWWYQWGTNGVDPDITPASCPPDPDDELYCDDGAEGTVGLPPGIPAAQNPLPLARAYLQKDPFNTWQAYSWPPVPEAPSAAVVVDVVDWGDNLESVDWYTRSQVRTEVVLFEGAAEGDVEEHAWPMIPEYEMRHTSGWGINEVHGLAATLGGTPMLGDAMMATVYSPCARFMIQRLLTDRDDPALADLEWFAGEGWAEPEGYEDDLINPPIFNKAVYEGGDGPGYYSAEINVKGRVIYGYTWSVRKLNEGAGDYRLTFSFDEACGTASLNTYFIEGITELKVPIEEELAMAALAAEGDDEGDTGGGVPVIDYPHNLTFIDISILERGGGGGGDGGGGKGGGGGGGGGGGPPHGND
jgi:hypothetical protein